MTEICGWRAFLTARTAKHLRKFIRIVTQAKKKSITTSRSTPSTHSFFLQCACILLMFHHSICSNSFWKFAATIPNLQQPYFICSNFILFAATLFYCSNFLICSVSLVDRRKFLRVRNTVCTPIQPGDTTRFQMLHRSTAIVAVVWRYN